MVLKGKAPNKKERDWMDKIANMGCIVCWDKFDAYSPAEVHHIDGKTKPGSHLNTIPLCFRHHREGINNDMYVSRHPYLHEFEKRYGTQESLLTKTKERL